MTVNQKRAKSTDLCDHLSKRPRRDVVASQVRQVLQRRRADRERYAGGLKAERSANKILASCAKEEVRALILGRKGRRIDLVSVLRQRRQDGTPRWCLVDPTQEIGHWNGQYDSDGQLRISGHYIAGVGHKNVQPQGGFPALPPAVRELARDKKIRKRAEFVGVLYQPEEWREVDPDPALIVKWRGVPGYFALAVWGGDMPQLMEFID